MKKWVRSSLKNQLLVFILIAVFVPVLFLGIVSYISTVNVSKERAEISGSSALGQLQTSLNVIVDDVLSMSVFLIGSRDVQDYMSEDESTPRQRSNINGFLANLAFSKDYISNITLYPISENPTISTNMHALEERDFSQNTENKWWTYQNYEKVSEGLRETITLTRPVRSLNDFRLIGYLSISINQDYMENLLSSIDLEWSGNVLLMQDSQVFAISGGKVNEINELELVGNINSTDEISSWTQFVNGDKSTVFSANIPKANWDLVGIIPYKEYSAQNRYLLSLTIFTVIIGSLLAFLLVIFLALKVLDPLLLLTKLLKHAKPGEKIKQQSLSADNEIGDLIHSYNTLNERITVLMEEVKASESLKRQVDLQALQSQINPHFLYNTLASIHWMALSSGSKEISLMVSSLSTYLRYSLNNGDEYCTVGQEINHLVHYSKIQEFRFPGFFSIHFEIPDGIKQSVILKLILQPLIENSILHGKYPGMSKLINIKIKIERIDQRLQFTVEDDGVGISRKGIEHLRNHFRADGKEGVVVGENYGLRNVNLRLIMHYGKMSKLHVSSEKNQGVSIVFSIPIEGANW